MIVSEDDLLCEESEWINFISETKERIRIANIPVIEEEVVEVEVPSTEPETVSTEVEVVTTEPTVSEVDYEGNIPEPTKEELQELLTKWIAESSKKQLLQLCRDLFLIKE
jgi:methionine salvage enolase-phosphatase E1